jgi:hypothetical protein
MAYYYNKKLANEIKQTQKDFIKSSPYYNKNDDFVSAQQKRFANRRSDGRHPFASGSERTLFQNPLYVGESQHFKNFEDYNDRSDDKINYHKKGGSLLYCKPELGSNSDYSSDSDYSSSDYSSSDDEEGAGFYDDVIKPVGRTIGNVGKEILKDVVLPIGKELLKDAIKGAVIGAGQKKMKNKDFNKILQKSKKCDNAMTDISHILKSAKVHSKKSNIKPIVGTKRGERVRGDVVAEVMKKRGVSLGQASKIVKEEGLY